MTNDTHTTQDLAALADAYLDAWNERDDGRRAELVARVWSEDGRLVDPPLTGEGHRGIADVAAALHDQFPDHAFRRASAIDAHHGFLRFAWELVGPDGAVAIAGLDVGELDDQGRLRRIVGFFGDLGPDGA